jgi:hypothetical protein
MKEILNDLNETIDQNQQRSCSKRSSSPKVFCASEEDLKGKKSHEYNMSEIVECVGKLRKTFGEMSYLPIPTVSEI